MFGIISDLIKPSQRLPYLSPGVLYILNFPKTTNKRLQSTATPTKAMLKIFCRVCGLSAHLLSFSLLPTFSTSAQTARENWQTTCSRNILFRLYARKLVEPFDFFVRFPLRAPAYSSLVSLLPPLCSLEMNHSCNASEVPCGFYDCVNIERLRLFFRFVRVSITAVE